MSKHVRMLSGLFAAVLVVCTITAADKKADDKAPMPVTSPIYKTDQPITIDGVLDEPAWKQALPVEAVYAYPKLGAKSADPHMHARFTWDDHYLYIGYETFDKNLVALGTGDKKGPKANKREGCLIAHEKEPVDVVEFFVSLGDLRFFWELHHNALNQFNDIYCIVADDSWPIRKSNQFRFGIHFGTDEVLKDDTDAGRTMALAVKLKPKADGKPSTVNEAGDADTGYIGELRLPWLGLGAAVDREAFVQIEVDGKKRSIHGPWKMAGQELRILSVMQDGDLKDHYHHSSPTLQGGFFHQSAKHWPVYVLEASKK